MKRKPLTIMITEEHIAALKQLASDLDKPADRLLEEAIEFLVRKYKTSPRKMEHILRKYEKSTIAKRQT